MSEVTTFSKAVFRPFVGEDFTLVDGEREVTVRFERLVDRGGAPHTTMFSLYFLVPPGGPTEQGVYRIEREGFGWAEVLFVPVQQAGDSIRFEVTMNLLGSDEEPSDEYAVRR